MGISNGVKQIGIKWKTLLYSTVIQFSLLMILSLLLIVVNEAVMVAQVTQASPPEIQSYNDLVLAIEEDARKDSEDGDSCIFSNIEKDYSEYIDKYAIGKRRALRQAYKSACKNARKANQWNIFESIEGVISIGSIAVMLVVALIGALVKDPIVKLAQSLQLQLGNWAYQRLSGQPWFWRWGLSKYRVKLRENYQTWKNPFSQSLSLNQSEIYVPLKVKRATAIDSISFRKLVDADQAIANQRRLMVIGSPGAGKSMLLQSIALRYAERKLRVPGEPLTILVELNKLSQTLKGSSSSEVVYKIEQQLIQVLEKFDFPNAGRLVRLRLGAKPGQPTLLILFDGLDEVSGDDRRLLTSYLQTFLQHYPHFRAVITCRTQVYDYDGEPLDRYVNQTLRVDEFSDQQIRRFLQPWEIIMTGKSIKKLIEELRDRPNIQELARNPMLLTIIASLYAGDDFFELPHSRARFYSESTSVLLKKWDQQRHSEVTRFEEEDKRSLLREIALKIQTTAVQRGGDRRDVNYEAELLPWIKKWLPTLSLDETDAKPILDDIRFRSGLLVQLDGGETYEFSHLTLQEFFAADKLVQMEEGLQNLIGYFRSDPNAWREVVKLACGLASKDKSKILLQQVYERDPLTAFEALVDVREIDPHLETKIIEDFKSKLGDINNPIRDLEAAFGLVAANTRSRGNPVFQFLIDTTKSLDANKRLAAIRALSLSNLPDAAKYLTTDYTDQPDMRDAMVSMGDLAVSHLHTHACQGTLFAIDDLLRIGTPDAATALADCLWSQQPSQALRAAWCLAALLPLPGITDEIKLSEKSLTEKQKAERLKMSESWKFIWDPFKSSDGDRSPVTAIAQRIAYLLETSDLKDLAASTVPQSPEGGELQLDPRLIVPLCTLSQKLKLDLRQISQRGWTSSAEALLASHSTPETRQPSSPVIESEISDIVQEILGKTICQSDWYRLLATQPPILQLDLIGRLVKPHMRSPTAKDWRQLMLRVGQYRFERSWQFCSIVIIALLMSFLAWVICFLMILKPLGWLGFLGLAIIPAAWMWLLADGWPIPPERFLSFGILGGFTFWQELWRTNKRGIAWGGAAAMQQCFSASHIIFPAAIVVAILGAIWAVLFQNSPSIVYGLVVVAIAAMLVSMGAWAGTGLSVLMQRGWRNRFIAGSSVVVVVLAVARAIALLLPNNLHGLGWSGLGIVMMGFGVSFWANAPAKLSCWVAILTYPLFCGFPTVLACLILPLLLSSTISPMTRLIVFGILFLIATGLWFLGKSQEYYAGNPFKDLPELAQPTQP